MNPFVRSVGIFYKDDGYMCGLWDMILDVIPADSIHKIGMSKHDTAIYMKDGSRIRFSSVKEDERGYNYHEIFIQPGIPFKDYAERIRVCLLPGGKCFIAEQLDDFCFRSKSADAYYIEHYCKKEDETMETGNDYMLTARRLVYDYVVEHFDKTDNVKFTIDDVYIVWFSKTLQNWKALLSTTIPDKMYYEVTFNGDKNEAYIDAYIKLDNRKVSFDK